MVGGWLVALRHLIFKRTKGNFWREVVGATQTFVTPPMDEYEKPSEIQEIPLNRISANPLRVKDLRSPKERMTASLFGQLKRHTSKWADSHWRKSFEDIQVVASCQIRYAVSCY